MYQFIETMCVVDGQPQLLEYHERRVLKTFERYFPNDRPLQLRDLSFKGDGKCKFRVVYDGQGVVETQNRPYSKKCISTLKLIRDDQIDYSFKSADRQRLEEVSSQCLADQDVIIVKNDKLTDSSYANLIFRKDNQWYTPEDFLLNGVKRQFLLNSKTIKTTCMSPEDIRQYESISLINALLDPGDVLIDVENVIF